MAQEILEIPTDEKVWFISVQPCDQVRDGPFIRELTREIFYDYFIKTIGWDEDRHKEEPKFPERYLMLFCESVCIGFLSLREQPHCLYLETLQLLPEYQRRGIGTGLIKFVEEVATRRAKDRIQLRVFKGNPVQSLYNRLGFQGKRKKIKPLKG